MHLEIEHTTLIHLLPLYVLFVVVIGALAIARPFLTASPSTASEQYSTKLGVAE